MKKNSIKGIYPGLMVTLSKKNEYFLKSTSDISKDSLLFEIGGKIVNNKYFEDNKEMLKNKNYKYFYFFSGNKYEENKNILILNKGNIAAFLKYGNKEESNVVLKSYVKEND